ncbi:MAG TPA: DUF1579 family protein [Planctomycetota bacterium]|jgi:hypothetical protein|nr:DUF1579 family protein [Planctomycetota bacterium]
MTGQDREMPAPPKAGPHHAHLARLVGKWRMTSKYFPAPGAAPVIGTGTETVRRSPDGLWFVTDLAMDDGTFHGHGVCGYDLFKKKYVGVWVDSMTTSLQLSEGECSEDGRVQTSLCEATDPATGRTIRMRMRTAFKDEKSRTFQIFQIGPDGKETLELEMIGTRTT